MWTFRCVLLLLLVLRALPYVLAMHADTDVPAYRGREKRMYRKPSTSDAPYQFYWSKKLDHPKSNQSSSTNPQKYPCQRNYSGIINWKDRRSTANTQMEYKRNASSSQRYKPRFNSHKYPTTGSSYYQLYRTQVYNKPQYPKQQSSKNSPKYRNQHNSLQNSKKKRHVKHKFDVIVDDSTDVGHDHLSPLTSPKSTFRDIESKHFPLTPDKKKKRKFDMTPTTLHKAYRRYDHRNYGIPEYNESDAETSDTILTEFTNYNSPFCPFDTLEVQPWESTPQPTYHDVFETLDNHIKSSKENSQQQTTDVDKSIKIDELYTDIQSYESDGTIQGVSTKRGSEMKHYDDEDIQSYESDGTIQGVSTKRGSEMKHYDDDIVKSIKIDELYTDIQSYESDGTIQGVSTPRGSEMKHYDDADSTPSKPSSQKQVLGAQYQDRLLMSWAWKCLQNAFHHPPKDDHDISLEGIRTLVDAETNARFGPIINAAVQPQYESLDIAWTNDGYHEMYWFVDEAAFNRMDFKSATFLTNTSPFKFNLANLDGTPLYTGHLYFGCKLHPYDDRERYEVLLPQ
eukprot:549772_1